MPEKGTSILPSPNPANPGERAGRAGGRIVAAAWPTGLAHLGVMVTACERCDVAELCRDWLACAPKAIDGVPPFCPNAGELAAAARRARR